MSEPATKISAYKACCVIEELYWDIADSCRVSCDDSVEHEEKIEKATEVFVECFGWPGEFVCESSYYFLFSMLSEEIERCATIGCMVEGDCCGDTKDWVPDKYLKNLLSDERDDFYYCKSHKLSNIGLDELSKSVEDVCRSAYRSGPTLSSWGTIIRTGYMESCYGKYGWYDSCGCGTVMDAICRYFDCLTQDPRYQVVYRYQSDWKPHMHISGSCDNCPFDKAERYAHLEPERRTVMNVLSMLSAK